MYQGSVSRYLILLTLGISQLSVSRRGSVTTMRLVTRQAPFAGSHGRLEVIIGIGKVHGILDLEDLMGFGVGDVEGSVERGVGDVIAVRNSSNAGKRRE